MSEICESKSSSQVWMIISIDADRIRVEHYFVYAYLNACTGEAENVALTSFCVVHNHNSTIEGCMRLKLRVGDALIDLTIL